MDRIDALRTFVRVVEAGSFSQAAEDLGIGQAAVSKRIAMLEREFRTRLFARTTRRLHLTPEADRIHRLAKEIVSTYDSVGMQPAGEPVKPTGTLQISVPTSFGRRYFSELFIEYMRRYPSVQLNVGFSENYVDLVESGYELALRIGVLPSSSLIARRVGTIRRYLVATPSFLSRHALPSLPHQLSELPCIAYARSPGKVQWTLESDMGRNQVDISPSLLCDDADAMTEATLHHLGIAVLPGWCAVPHLQTGRLAHVLPDFAIPSLPLNIVYPNANWMSNRARMFCDLVIEHADLMAADIWPERR